MKDKRLPVVGVGKHLCGAATGRQTSHNFQYSIMQSPFHNVCSLTDLALRCLFDHLCKEDDEPPTKRVKLRHEQGAGDEMKSVPPTEATSGGLLVSGLAVALCCHHRCDWRHYVGKEFFRQRGLGPEDFAAFQRMSSWATCGMRKFGSKVSEQPSDRNTEDEEEHEKNDEAIPDILNGWVNQPINLLLSI